MSTQDADALALFVKAKIGGEPLGTTATSELMLRTVTKGLGAGGTLIDSPALGLPAAKPLTRTIRGAGVAVYLLSDTLGGRGLKRGFGLLVLALGATLVAVSLLSSAAPAWLATAGFGILLGGLAYAALASGMLTHALVLATPVVPLMVWSAAQNDEPGQSDPGRIIQIGLIVLLIVTALLMGSVSTPVVDPRDWASAPQRRWRVWLGRLLLLLVVAAAIAGLAVLAARLDLTSWAWIGGLGAALGAAAVVLGAVALRHASRVRSAAGDPAAPPQAARAAIGAAWAWTYGALYVVCALVLGVVLAFEWESGAAANDVLVSLAISFAVLALVCFGACLRVRVAPRAAGD